MGGSTSAAIERGRGLFNARSFFEAHEAWEEAWLTERGERRRVLQGLIQLAAAFHKIARGDEPGGCLRLLEWGRVKIEGPAKSLPSLDLAGFRSRIRAFEKRAQRWERGEEARPASFPRLRREQTGRQRTSRARTRRSRKTSPS